MFFVAVIHKRLILDRNSEKLQNEFPLDLLDQNEKISFQIIAFVFVDIFLAYENVTTKPLVVCFVFYFCSHSYFKFDHQNCFVCRLNNWRRAE